MEGLFSLIIGIIIVVVSVMNQKRRRDALAAEERRRLERRRAAPETETPPEPAAPEGEAAELRDVLGEILRQVGGEAAVEEKAAPEPGEPREGGGDEHAPAAASGRTAWTPREARYRKPLIAEDSSSAENAPERPKKTAAYKAPLIPEEGRAGGESRTAPHAPAPSWKEPLIKAASSPSALFGAGVSGTAESAAVQPATQRSSYALRFVHAGREQIRDGMVWAEILGKPLGLRDE